MFRVSLKSPEWGVSSGAPESPPTRCPFCSGPTSVPASCFNWQAADALLGWAGPGGPLVCPRFSDTCRSRPRDACGSTRQSHFCQVQKGIYSSEHFNREKGAIKVSPASRAPGAAQGTSDTVEPQKTPRGWAQSAASVSWSPAQATGQGGPGIPGSSSGTPSTGSLCFFQPVLVSHICSRDAAHAQGNTPRTHVPVSMKMCSRKAHMPPREGTHGHRSERESPQAAWLGAHGKTGVRRWPP